VPRARAKGRIVQDHENVQVVQDNDNHDDYNDHNDLCQGRLRHPAAANTAVFSAPPRFGEGEKKAGVGY
jgi:hypothetical protein